MQRPTHPRLHIRDARDAHIVLEAVRRGLLPPIKRRLNEHERGLNIRSGAVFVWEESNDETGLRRWTDSRLWSQSRMREPFLFYDERLPDEMYDVNSRAPNYRFVDGASRGVPTPAVAHYDRSSHHPKGLVKQAYSALVSLSPHEKARKWHLTAYFSYGDLEEIPTVDQDLTLRKVSVPPGIFRNGKSRSRDNGAGFEDPASSQSSSVTSSPTLSTSQARPPAPPCGQQDPRYGSSGTHPVTLPPLQAPPGQGGASTRLPEDQRLIHMLNSRHVR
ncbi:hypothetical protein FIBSPDRAFT_891358 [Athelia psychrophila]|uniref:Gti1/Pac2 family-domain-containing protein n=1 Tax=Athelia psychrophila TaxID=1759441 RepID=A0A166JTG8_9AGAM|nr:hypothetical protein FIBSPDRAFT_891358 [Fibularhizoctonia sp. CBS 109695]